MNQELEILKGIHPGVIVERKIKERKLSKGRFALMINEYPQTLGAIPPISETEINFSS